MGLAHAPPLAPRPALIALCLAVFLAPPGGHDDGVRASMRPRLGWADAAVVASCPMGDDATLRTTGSAGLVNSGDLSSPTTLVSGCAYDFYVGDKSELYLRIPRANSRQRLSVEWNLQYEYKAPTFAFTWNGQATSGRNPFTHVTDKNVMYADWQWTPTQHCGSHTFAMDDDGEDEYHCSPACQTHDATSKTGELYVTLSSWQAYNPVEGTVAVYMEEPNGYITSAQLDVVRSIYDANCANRLAGSPSWSSDEYFRTESTDVDTTPHCDWIPGGWNNAWHTSNACDAIPGIACDGSGNVVSLKITEKGLAGDLPPGLAGRLPKLREVKLDGNLLEGNVLELLMYSRTMTSFSASRNRLTGRVPCPGAGRVNDEDEAVKRCESNDGDPDVTYKGAEGLYHLDLGYNALDGEVPARCLVRCSPGLAVVKLGSNRLTGTVPVAFASLRESMRHLDLSSNELHGQLPVEFGTLDRIQTLDLSLNRIGGQVPGTWMTDMEALYTLDLAHNRLTGEFPTIGANMRRLRRVFLGHNRLRGEFGAQLTKLYDSLKSNEHERDSFAAGTSYSLSGNKFSGPLPYAVYSLFTHPKSAISLEQVHLGGNRFRCDRDTGGWPAWAARLQLGHLHSLGQCQPVPVVTAVGSVDRTDDAIRMGAALEVNGTDFVVNGDEARCRFAIRDGRDGSGTERWRYVYTRATIAPAWGSEDESSEMNPPSALTCDAGTFDASNLKFPVDAVVSVAMFGNDFYDESTVAYGKYVERTVRLRCARGTAGSNCQYTAKTHCNDAGTPNDEGWCVCDEGYAGNRCGECAAGWSAGSSSGGDFGIECERSEADVSSAGLVPWAEWALIGGTFVTTGLAAFLYVLVARERKGTPMFGVVNRALVDDERHDVVLAPMPSIAVRPGSSRRFRDANGNASGNEGPFFQNPFTGGSPRARGYRDLDSSVEMGSRTRV